MARPSKEGLEYFSLDCRFSDSVKLIQAEFGLVGIGILIRLWQKIYGERGYYTKWDTDVALVFASECNVGANVVCEVVSACIRRGLFDKNLYDRFGILTSASIQMRFAEATSRRDSQKVFADYLLIPVRKNWVSVCNNSINAYDNSKNVDDNPQSKEKKSKVKNKEISDDISICADSQSEVVTGGKGKTKFVKPTVEEIRQYCLERNNGIDPETFYHHYESNGWRIGKTPMKSWKSAIITWERKRQEELERKKDVDSPSDHTPKSYDLDEFFEAAVKRGLKDLS